MLCFFFRQVETGRFTVGSVDIRGLLPPPSTTQMFSILLDKAYCEAYSQYIPLHPDKFHRIPGSHSGGLVFHFVCCHRVITWSVAFCSYIIQSEAFPLNIYTGETIRFAEQVSNFSCFQTIRILPSPKRFDMVDVTMM